MTRELQPHDPWPPLSYAAWRDTCSTLQLWTQTAGKIRLARTPWLNHSWHVPLYVTATGLTTSPIPDGSRSFELQFDFSRHRFIIDVSDGSRREIALAPMSVADFYAAVKAALSELKIDVAINDYPCEIAGAIAFSKDRTHASYDPKYVERFFRVLSQVDRILKQFRTGFVGKASPVHFFWGSFDLAVTRFSGRRAPDFQGKVPGLATEVMREAYSHEVSSAGFWPGSGDVDASFYAYAYPSRPGFKESPVLPEGATWSEALGEFLLPYETMRNAADPEAALLSFLQSTYEAAAISASWDREALECPRGVPGVPIGQ